MLYAPCSALPSGMEKGKAREGEGKSVMGTFRRVGVPRETAGLGENFTNSGTSPMSGSVALLITDNCQLITGFPESSIQDLGSSIQDQASFIPLFHHSSPCPTAVFCLLSTVYCILSSSCAKSLLFSSHLVIMPSKFLARNSFLFLGGSETTAQHRT
jgi:hypothetical protein